MKRRILCIVMILSLLLLLCACSAQDGQGHTLYVRDTYSHEKVEATFKNTATGETETVTMKKISEDDDAVCFSCQGDTAKFDRVILTYNDDESTDELAFNDYVSGWEINSYRYTPYVYEGNNEKPDVTWQMFDYESRKKDVYIWTPEDYDPNSAEKYSVIYMPDGQNLFDPAATSTGSWAVAESVRAMMKESDNKAIVVGIDTSGGYRDEELTPNIGKSTQDSYDNGKGAYFCDFVYNTVVPYIEENYNVYTDREHNAVCGSSSGGIECFYIGMEHPEKFGTIGALSPAFGLFDNATWDKYLSEKDFSAGYPFVYIYNGASIKDELELYLLEGAKDMPENLKKIGYPEDKIVIKTYDKGVHKELAWRAVFPEFLKYMFPKANEA